MAMQAIPEEKSMLLVDEKEIDFIELYSKYFSRVNSYVHYRINERNDADDITSLIFEKMLINLTEFKPEIAPISSWIFCISRNTVIDYYRHRHLSQLHFISLEASSEPENNGPNPEDLLVLNETKQQLSQALVQLTNRERQIIVLKYWEDLSNKDISKKMGISESNTGVILYRALKRLKEILE